MATTYNIVTGSQGISEARDYYGPYLSQLRGDPDNPVWGGGAQKVPYETGSQAWGWAKFVAGTGALFASGFVPISWKGKQYRLWDAYVEGLRYLEEYSPGRVLRTFQASSLLSPLEARSRALRVISPETMMSMAQGPESAAWHAQLEFLGKQAGRPFTTPEILERGLRFEGGKLMVEGTGEVLLQHAAVIRNVAGSSNLLEAAARNVEARVVPNMFSLKIPFGPGEAAETFSFIGGKTRAELAGRIGGAYATELMERVNRLFRAPAEMEPLRSLWEKGPGRFIELGVKPGKHYEVFGRMLLKYGWGLPAGIAAYKFLDYQVRDAGLLNWSIFDEGITAGLATTWTKANLAYHHVADALGWQSYGRWQEEAAPGSTSLSRMLGFPITTGIAGLAALGIHRGIVTAGLQKGGMPLGEASTEAMKRVAAFEGDNWFAKLGRKLASRPPMKFLGKITPGKLAFGIGAAIGLAPVLPFLPGALAPEYTAEDLEAFYSGRKEVPVRAGRWWEMGRSSYEGGRIIYHRPHWYRRLIDRSKDKAIWGPIEEEEGVDELSPFKKWWIANMTYDLERAHYYDRPFPMTSTFGTDIPLIGPVVAGTIGKVIKPPLLMHTDAWLRSPDPDSRELSRGDIANWNEQQALHGPTGYGGRRALELGEQAPGMPISPYGIKGTVGEQIYRATEWVGLPGFVATAIKEKVTGTPDWFDQEMQLESAAKMTSMERAWWDQEIGGALGLCFVAGTLIMTKEGQKPIEAIKEGDQVLSKGVYREVEATTHRLLAKGESLVTVMASFTGISITSTSNHKIPIIRRHTYSRGHVKPFESRNYDEIEARAEDIRPGDLLLYQIDTLQEPVTLDLGPFGRATTEKYVYDHASLQFAKGVEALEGTSVSRQTRGELRKIGIPDQVAKEVIGQYRENIQTLRHKRYIEIDEDIAYFLGWYLAEGSSDLSKVQLVMHAKERPQAEILLEICKRKFGCNGLITIKGNALILRIYSSLLARALPRWVGTRARNKRIPIGWQRLPLNILRKLTDGLLEGDGWQGEGWEGGFGSTSRVLVKDLVRCLLKLGRHIGVTLDYLEIGRGTYPQGTLRKPSFRHYLYLQKGHQKWRFYRQFTYLAKVNKVEVQKNPCQQAVYDLTVKDLHYYTADDILVHNSEGLRRLYPHRRRQIQQYNPIPNQMPSWLPGPGDRSADFSTGDPYTRIPLGESRLPGRGYAARYPELEGVMPEDYPLLHRLKILSDVAPFSTKYEEHLTQTRMARNQGLFSDYEEDMYQMVMEQAKAKKQRREFHEYKYRDRELPVATRALMKAGGEEKPGFLQRMFGSYWEELSHRAETPLEYLTPVAPAHKLIHMRSALEDYAATQVYGTESSFWQHPWRHFLRPFIDTSKAAVGLDGIPAHVQQRRGIEEYFDILKYIKSTRLQEIAGDVGDKTAYEEFGRLREETLVGVNPYSFNYEAMFRALPRRDRDYFNSFVKADLEDRQKILDLIPDNEKRLYEALWDIKDTQDRSKAIKKDLLSDREEEKARDAIADTYSRSGTEGFPTSRELWAEYLATRIPGESYVDWYRRTKLIEKRLAGQALPPADWVGWNPSTDLEDIKLKVVEHLGLDHHDFNLWPSRRSQLPYKPFIDKEAVDAIVEGDQSLNQGEIRRRIQELLTETGMRDIEVTMMPAPRGRDYDEVDLRVDEDRTYDLVHTLQREGMVR